jgi:hypothetical protein
MRELCKLNVICYAPHNSIQLNCLICAASKAKWPIIIIIISIYKKSLSDGFGDVNLQQFKFTLLDGSQGLHISEWMVSISYTFC